MASVLQQYHQLADRMATQITGSYQSWTDFLTTAARLYKYPYHEQLMIYAQRPEATACADYELWNKRMGRYVRQGAKGIALIDHSRDTPKLKYVFDVADTRTTERSRSPYLWEYRPEHEQVVSAAMEEQYNIQYPGNLVDQLEQISSVKITEYFLVHQQDILDIVDGSYLEQYHDYDKGVAFLNAATVSTTYMLLSRCGLAENAHFGPEDFMPVFDFNTPQTVDALGSAISGISEEILRNIEVTIKKYEREKLSERSQENERTDLHSQRGLLDSQPDSVPAGKQAPGQVREDAEEVSTGASPGAVEPTDPVGAAVSPSAGDRRDGEPALGADDAEADTVGRGDGSSESQRPDEVGGADEQPESPGRGSDPDGADLHLTEDSPVEQFPFFPTEAQQIESITEAERVQATPSAFSMFISLADIDHILRTGGNEDDARMKIVAEFSKQKPLENRAAFLKALYHGGNGLITENGKISAWYSEDGIYIASGDTARYLPSAQVISWADAAGRTEELLNSGTFATNLEVAEAPRNERQRIAAEVWGLYHDLSDEAKSLGHLSCLSNIRSTNYPEETERLTDELANPAFREILLTESRAFVDAYRENRELLRFHYHRPQVLLTQLEELSMPRKEYHSSMAALPETGKFITEDEIADSLANGSSFEGGKSRIYAFFQAQHSPKECADFLKEEYGTGGRSHAVSGESGSFEEHGSKGIVLKKSDCTDIQMNWNKVASRISELIRLNRYFTPDEQVLYDEKLAQATARTIAYNSYNAVKESNLAATLPTVSLFYDWYAEVKSQYPDAIVLIKLNGGYLSFQADTQFAATLLGLEVVQREHLGEPKRVSVCYLPNEVVEEYLDRLGEKNKTVVLADRQPGKDNIDILQIAPQSTRHIDEPSQEHPPVAPTDIPPIREITQADIDAALQKWNGNSESKQAVASYMEDHGRERDTAAWLAKEYGTDLSHPLRVIVTGVDDEVVLPWPKVQRRIAQLIREDKFFTQQEKTVLEHNQEYQLLDRLRSDCEYFLGAGNRAEKHLWTGSVRAQISKMRELYDTLPEKPEWLTKETIDDYAERMAPPYLVVAYHHFENGFDDKLDYQTLAEAEKAAQGYVDGTMEGDGFQYDGAAIYNQQTRKYLRVYGNYPDERAHAEAAGRDWVEKSAASTESDIAPADRFHVVSLDQGFYIRYAIWDDEADGYYVDADGVAEEFTSEWQAEEYRLKLQEQVLMERAKGLISDFCQSEYGSEPDFSDPAKIGIAYTTITDDEIPIQVNIDLVKFRLERDLNGEHLETRQYSSLQDLIANELEILDFSDLVHVSDEDIEQYRWHNREEATEKALETVESVSLPQENKALYSVGNTVYLDNKPFEITEVGLFDVHLRDPSQAYPVFRAESKERLEVLLRQDERNAHLFAVKPPAISEEEKLILEHEGQAALSEMGELIPDPDDAISQSEPDEPPAHSPAVSILIDGQWQGFPSASAAEKASYADFKAASHRNAQNFRITDDDLGAGGAKAKFQANLNAIQLLKHLEAEGLQASPEQQQVLSRYVGWGGLPDAFDASKPSWASEYQELKAALTPEEYTAARASTLNAHYTSPTVIRAIYEAVGNMGFQTGNILEPSMGIGNFFGMLPENMRGSRLYGVELDSITGRIAKQLYPKANITIAGFETTDRRDFFDLAVGNVPFGQYKVNDPAYNKLGFNIHNYFFAKALDQVRPGGVVAFVTSRYSMDAQNPSVRKYLAQRADLLGAIRLPNTAFKANAGTEVVSDILFLQKRDRAIDIEPDWVHLGQTEDGYAINSYFLDHPEMVMGRNSSESTAHGMDYTVVPLEDSSLADQLHKAVQHIHGTYQEVELPDLGEGESIQNTLPADPDVKNFSYTLVDGEVYFRENSIMVRPDLNATAKERIKGMLALSTCVHELIDLQMDETIPDSAIRDKQAELNRLYDSFTEKHGLINSRGNKLAFSDDSSYFLLCALEVMDDDGNFQRKADMFTKRTIQPHRVVTSVDTASAALTLSIAEKAEVNMEYMSNLTGKTAEELASELRGVIFHDPTLGNAEDGMGWVTADEYLSGNVRQKLRQAEAAAAENPAYQVNVEALRAAQPKDLDASEIEVRLGATWIDRSYIKQFMFETFDTPSYLRYSMDVQYSPYTAAWSISNKTRISYNDVAAWNTYGTDCVSAYEILEDSLNLRDVQVFDTIEDADGRKKRVLNAKETTLAAQKQQLIRDAFRDWIWAEPQRRQALVRQYNEEMNSTRPREYDGSHIVFAGMNPEITLREHQRNAIAHVLYGGNTLLAHEVGAGKTFEMVAAAMESKRLGLCQKSIFVVPNHLTEQWASEFLRLYPSANILVTKQRDFETKNRKKFCARIATGDYDAVIIGHSQFEKIPISKQRQERLLQDQIAEITMGISELKESGGEKFSVKELERTKRGLESRLEKLRADDKKDDVVTFEELGVDRMFVDEAHNYKNLFLYTKMRNIAGLSTTDAQKSSDMFGKCRYMDELTGNRGVVFATGTPVSNSMTELYTMQRYLQYARLEEMHMTHFDCWASRFGETVTALELAPEGKGYRPRTRFSRFFNLPELMNLFKEVADIKTADQLHLPVPEVEYHNVVAKPTEVQKGLVQELSERAAAIHSGSVDPSIDNMLKVTSDGRKLGLDQRIINPDFPDQEGSKVNLCVENILQVWKDGEADKLTQLVFCDISTPQAAPKAKKAVSTNLDTSSPESAMLPMEEKAPFTVYDDIRSKLIARGVPAEQIAFIHDVNTEVKKKELFGKVRSGQVRVLLGSTSKMGAGTNVQDRLVAIHDVDCPWRPGDLQQRKGRIERQGNQNEKVHVFRYVTEGTFDAYLWQTVENKQKFISQIMSSKSPVRSCDDVDEVALSFAEIKALCAGDPRIKERMDLDVEVSKLKIMKADYKSKQYRLEDNLLRHFPEQIEKLKGCIQAIQEDMQMLDTHPHPQDGFAGMTVLADKLTDKDNAGAALIEAAKKATGLDPVEIGTYRGFQMSVTLEDFGKKYVLTMQGRLQHQTALGSDPRGNLIRLDNALAQMPQRLQAFQTQLDETYHQQEAAKAELDKPFPYEEELRDKTARLIFLDAELNLDANKGGQQEQVVAKAARPSVLDKLRSQPAPSRTGKKQKRYEEVR